MATRQGRHGDLPLHLVARGASIHINHIPDISVIIVSWNVRAHLLRCLDALLSAPVCEGLRLEVIVVDNASRDGTLAAIKDYPVKVIANETNMGYGRANNIGLRVARGRHLLALNPDTAPQPGSIRALLHFMQTHPKVGIVSPRLFNPDGTVQASAFTFPTLAMAAIDLFPLPRIVPGRWRRQLERSPLNGRYPAEMTSDKPFKIDHPLGACMLLRREAYEQCGGFDERIFMYSEEIDLALRYAQAGWQCWQAPAARVVHLGRQSTRQLPDTMFVELWRSRLYIYARHYGLPARLALSMLLITAMLRDIIGVTLLRMLGKGNTQQSASRSRRAEAVLRLVFKR